MENLDGKKLDENAVDENALFKRGKAKSAIGLYGFEGRESDLRRKGFENFKGRGVEKKGIKQLWQLSHEVIGLTVLGMNQKEIARRLGISAIRVSNIVNSDLAISKISSMREVRDNNYLKLKTNLESLHLKAVGIYEKILDSEDKEDWKLQKATADTILLDLTEGLKTSKKIELKNKHFIATDEEIDDFKSRGNEVIELYKSSFIFEQSKINESEDEDERN